MVGPIFLRAVALAAVTIAASAAEAVTTFTFGQATQMGRPNTVRWARAPSPNPLNTYVLSSIVRAGVQPRYDFRFFFPDSTSYLFQTRMTLAATSSSAAHMAALPGTSFQQELTGGTIQFKALAPVTVGSSTGTNVLTVSFTGGKLVGKVGGTSMTLQASEPLDTIFYTSDFMNFSNTIEDNFAFSMSSVNPAAGLTGTGVNTRIRGFTASSTATFATTVVPEPTTWAMLIVGFGLVGVAMRRRPLAA